MIVDCQNEKGPAVSSEASKNACGLICFQRMRSQTPPEQVR